MGIYIKGMEMPTKGNPITVLIYPDGTAEWEAQHKTGTAIPVPPHGDLIERDAAYDKIAEQEGGNYVDMDAVGMGLNETPTIIEAEEAVQKDGGQDE